MIHGVAFFLSILIVLVSSPSSAANTATTKASDEPAEKSFVTIPRIYPPVMGLSFQYIPLEPAYAGRPTRMEISAASMVGLDGGGFSVWASGERWGEETRAFRRAEIGYTTRPLYYHRSGSYSRERRYAYHQSQFYKCGVRYRHPMDVGLGVSAGLRVLYASLPEDVDWDPFEEVQPYGHRGGTTVWLELEGDVDTRDHAVSPWSGSWLRAGVAVADADLMGDETITRRFLDLRHYQPLSDSFTLALRSHRVSDSGAVPFFELSTPMVLGYEWTAFPARHVGLLQAELRYRAGTQVLLFFWEKGGSDEDSVKLLPGKTLSSYGIGWGKVVLSRLRLPLIGYFGQREDEKFGALLLGYRF